MWLRLEDRRPITPTPQSNPVQVSEAIVERIHAAADAQRVVEGDEEDHPPVVEVCVGRTKELRAIHESNARVVFLNGIGGQGKSTVAAKYFTDAQKERTFSHFIWRDCKEESERFENQLIEVAVKLSVGKLRGEDLSKQDAAALIEVVVEQLRPLRALFVFDNVDHYIDLETNRLIGAIELFVQALLESNIEVRAIFTCRPSVQLQHDSALTLRLEGLSLEAAIQLFSERGAPSEPREIEDAHVLTEGHAFWLDLLAIQVTKRASLTDLDTLLTEIRSGGGPLPTKTLSSVWATLRDREQLVLRMMAETVKPETEAAVADYLSGQIGYNKVIKAIKTLRSLNLVVVKQRPGELDVIELHPLVRQFIRQSFEKHERVTFVDHIIRVYALWIGQHRFQLFGRPPLSTLEYWTQVADLETAAGRYGSAFKALAEVADAFFASNYTREFSRTVRNLFAVSDWVTDYGQYEGFETVFSAHVRLLSHLGEFAETDMLLDMYAATVPNKDARYINYCEMRCTAKWSRADFASAVDWGKKGKLLKEASNVDTHYNVDHALALAERDAGRPEAALPIFLKGRALAVVVDPNELEEERGGPHYGNVGRCLHFMGKIDEALVCYQKSALLIEEEPKSEFVINQGYIRAWIGELLAARSQKGLAAVFLQAAYLKWEKVSPPKARKASQLLKQLQASGRASLNLNCDDVEETCLKWIMGHNVDNLYQ